MIYVISLVIVLAVFAGLIIYLDNVRFSSGIKEMAADAGKYPMEWFERKMTVGLPAPVAKYLQLAIPEGFPILRFVNLRHSGKFRTAPGKPWKSISGEQYFTMNDPSFIWRGKTLQFTAEDKFIKNKGRLKVWLLSLFPVASIRGSGTDEGELQRWIAEHFWFPTNLMNQELFTWEPVDDHTSRVILHYNNRRIPVTFHFDEHDWLSEVTCSRHMTRKKVFPWTGAVGEYQNIQGLKVPAKVTATWNLPGNDFTYADFELTSISFLPDPEFHFKKNFKHRETLEEV